MRIALDAMGGDLAPAAPVAGAIEASKRYPDVEILLVGDPAPLERELAGHGGKPKNVTIVASDGVVGMDEEPVRVMKSKPRNSARVTAECLAAGQADGVVSLGHTGAAVAAATLFCKRIDGVHRLGIAVPFPRRNGVTIVVDCGGIVDARPEHLYTYAVMARHYVRAAFGVAEPKVGILSVGEEEHKGNKLVKETWELFKKHPIPGFVGNVEGRHLFRDTADVVVCDGFTGNSLLKGAEGLGEMLIGMVKEQLAAIPAIAPLLKELARRVDYAEYGGAPLLGVRGAYVIGHGRSDAKAVANAIRVAHDYIGGRRRRADRGRPRCVPRKRPGVSAFTALVFPGQGAQHVGMGADVAAVDAAAAAVFRTASQVLGYDLLRLCAEGPAAELLRTDVQQPAILATGAAVVSALRASGRLPDAAVGGAMGLSLGEFTALWSAGSLALEDALVLVRERGLGMQEASAAVPSGMSALRCEPEVAEAACAKARDATKGVCVVANLNAPGQVVISGDLPTLAAAEEAAKAAGVRRPIRLEVAGAFHSPLMAPGARRLEKALASVVLKRPRFPVWSNVTGRAHDDPAEIRRNLIAQVTSPVRFLDDVRAARAAGMVRAVEAPPGLVLSGLLGKIDAAIEVRAVPNADAFAAFSLETPS